MVKKGTVVVELVNAATKVPFPEHTSQNGEAYVEVEPGVEYYINIQNHGKKNCILDFEVDGVDLGFRSKLSNGRGNYEGLRTRNDGHVTTRALSFAKSFASSTQGGGSWTGQVQVKLSRRGAWHPSGEDFQSRFERGTVADATKKSVQTVKGAVTTTSSSLYYDIEQVDKELEDDDESDDESNDEKLIGTITLKYCTALGLIHAGILPKPPLWEYHRICAPAKKRTTSSVCKITPKPKKIKLEDPRTRAVLKEYEFFDLTATSGSESDSESDGDDCLILN